MEILGIAACGVKYIIPVFGAAHVSAEIIPFPTNDGGKSRIKARQERLDLAAAAIMAGVATDDLTMDHADPGACGFGASMEDDPV